MNEQINAVVTQLNDQIKINNHESQNSKLITDIMTNVFLNEMNQIDPSQRKRFYQKLSLKFHPDKESQEPFMQVLRSKGLELLPQQLLNDISRDELESAVEKEPSSYNLFFFVQSIKPRILKILVDASTQPIYLIRLSSDPTTLSNERLANLSEAHDCYMLFEDKIYYFDSQENLVPCSVDSWPEIIQLFPDEVDKQIFLDKNRLLNTDLFFISSYFWSALKNEFPDLYLYEQYPKQVQNVIWYFALGVNLSAALLFGANLLVTINLYGLIKALELNLLEFVTTHRYANQPAKIAVMKATLEVMSVPFVDLSDDDIEHAFNSIMLKTKASQQQYLKGFGYHDVDHLIGLEFDFLFKTIYLNKTIIDQSASLSDLSNHDSVVKLRDFFRRRNLVKMSVAEIVEAVRDENLNDLINDVYTLIDELKNKEFQNNINQVKYSFSGFEHLTHAFSAMTEQWMLNATWTMQATQIILGLVLMPLTFIRFLFEAEYYLIETTLLLIKMASVGLINLPLYIQSHFNSKSQPERMPSVHSAPRLGFFAHSDVILTNDDVSPGTVMM